MTTKTIQKLFSVFACFSLLANSLYAPASVLAQELTPEPTAIATEVPVQTPEATIEPSATPTESPVPTEEPTTAPTIEPTPEQTSTPSESSQPQAPPVETSTPTSSPTPSPSPSPESEIIEPTLETQETTLLDQILSTGKLDYAPDEEVDIHGKGLHPVTVYSLVVTSSDEPPVLFSTSVITDSEGAFDYYYQLDEIYRPNYSVELFLNNESVSMVTFTDSNNSHGRKVIICHATHSDEVNPYNRLEVDDDAVNGHGHSDHNRNDHQNGEDIIPPFDKNGNDGYWNSRNWDAEGRAIWRNGCEVYSGKISITKDTDPETSNTKFYFDGSLDDFDLYDDEIQHFTNLEDGTYTIYENEKSGWKLTEVTCNQGANYEVNLENNSVEIDLDEDEEVSCTFNNVRAGSISGEKYNDENEDGRKNHGLYWIHHHLVWVSEDELEDWVIFIDENGNSQLDNGEVSTTTDEDGDYKFEGLLAGTYRICEVQQEGWVNTDPGNICQTLNLSEGENEHGVDFGNHEFEETTITVIKDVVDPDLNPVTDNSVGFVFNMTGQDPFTLYDEDGGETFTVEPGTYTITETPNTDYIFSGCTAEYEGESEGQTVEYGKVVTVEEGDSVTVTCINAQDPVVINGTKWNDLNGNGQRDYQENESQEPGIGGWTIFIDANENGVLDEGEISTTTDENGHYSFNGDEFKPGTYRICEVQQEGWQQTYPGDESCHDIELGSNETSNGNDFGNFHRLPSITIAKSNNKSAGVGQNDTITYTLIVTNTGNMNLNNVEVLDALPGGFSYVSGTTLLNGFSYSDPTISSGVLTWNVGYLENGDSATITYNVVTPSDLVAGNYKNLATCRANVGGIILEDSLFRLDALLISEDYQQVECDPATSTVTMNSNQSYGGNIEGTVLGASTMLPGTGSETSILVAALAVLGFGLGFKLISRRKYAKN